jgi:hypothetical protein
MKHKTNSLKFEKLTKRRQRQGLMNDESVSVTAHQTISERDEQERTNDLGRLRSPGIQMLQ